MKNTIILLLCAIFLLGLAGCGGKSPDESVAPTEMREEKTTDSVDEADSKIGNDAEESASGLASPRDRTIPFEGIDIEGKEVVMTGTGEADIETSYLTAESLVPDSAYIVKGKVEKVTYSHVDGNAITFYDLQLEEVWADRVHEGDEALIAGDIITVYQPGGYVLGDVFSSYRSEKINIPADSLVLQTILGMPLPIEGAEYVLFMTDSPEPAYKGIFMVTGVYQGRYIIEGDQVRRYAPENENPYLDEGQNINQLRETVFQALEEIRPIHPPTLEECLENYLANIQSSIEFEKQQMEDYPEEEEWTAQSESRIEELKNQEIQLPAFMKKVLSRADGIAARATEHPSILLLSHTSPEKAYGGNSFASTLIERAGAVNAAKKLTSFDGLETAVTMEQIAEMDPDIIVIYSTIYKDYYTAEDILSNAELQEVSAVKKGRVYEADVNEPWFSSGEKNEYIEGWMGIAYLQTLLYPEEYTEEQFKADYLEYYTIAYPQFAQSVYEEKFGEG